MISLKTVNADPKILQAIDEKQKKLKEKIEENKMKEDLEKKMIAHQKVFQQNLKKIANKKSLSLGESQETLEIKKI